MFSQVCLVDVHIRYLIWRLIFWNQHLLNNFPVVVHRHAKLYHSLVWCAQVSLQQLLKGSGQPQAGTAKQVNGK